jgi:hypothetical protein
LTVLRRSATGGADGAADPPSYVTEFVATSDGLALAKAFMRVGDARLRRTIAGLAEDCANLKSEFS